MTARAPNILICAGEASGDLHAAKVVEAVRRRVPEARFLGVAGRAMEAAGVEGLHRAESLAVVGFVEVARHLPRLRRVMLDLEQRLSGGDIDLCFTIDYPGFNLRLAARARRLGIPTLHYVAPTIWAWGRHRARTVRRDVSQLAVIFDFEEEVWSREGVAATWVGNPLLDDRSPLLPQQEIRRRVGAGPSERLVALLPGSRTQEVARLLPPLLSAAEHLAAARSGLRFVIPRAPSLDPSLFSEVHSGRAAVSLIEGEAPSVLRAADAAAVASGTATLEAALAGVPHVLVYRVSPATWWLGRTLVRLDRIGLGSIVAGLPVAEELLQDRCTPLRIATALLGLLEDASVRAERQAGMGRVRSRLGSPGAAERSAELLLRTVGWNGD